MGKSKKPVIPDGPSENLDTMEMLKTFVNKHQVCWEVLPEQIPIIEDRPLQVGFDLRLYGTHGIEDHPVPGCEKCKTIYKGLRKIAKRIIPKESRPSRYEIEIFDSAIRYDRVRAIAQTSVSPLKFCIAPTSNSLSMHVSCNVSRK